MKVGKGLKCKLHVEVYPCYRDASITLPTSKKIWIDVGEVLWVGFDWIGRRFNIN